MVYPDNEEELTSRCTQSTSHSPLLRPSFFSPGVFIIDHIISNTMLSSTVSSSLSSHGAEPVHNARGRRFFATLLMLKYTYLYLASAYFFYLLRASPKSTYLQDPLRQPR